MSNFEYIIASLPFLTMDYKYEEGRHWDSVIEEIKENLSEKDTEVLDELLKGFKADNLNADFYAVALKHPVKFIREYFRFDLNLRNAKVRYINGALGRPADQDLISREEDELEEFPQESKVQTALALSSLLDREQALDDVTWEVIDGLGTFHYFDITAVLCYVAKLHIADRWLALDEERGRERFQQLVKEVRGTFHGVEFKG